MHWPIYVGVLFIVTGITSTCFCISLLRRTLLWNCTSRAQRVGYIVEGSLRIAPLLIIGVGIGILLIKMGTNDIRWHNELNAIQQIHQK